MCGSGRYRVNIGCIDLKPKPFERALTFMIAFWRADKLKYRAVRVAQWKHQRLSPLGPGFDSGRSRVLCDREGDSLWQRRFSLGALVSSYITLKKSPIMS